MKAAKSNPMLQTNSDYSRLYAADASVYEQVLIGRICVGLVSPGSVLMQVLSLISHHAATRGMFGLCIADSRNSAGCRCSQRLEPYIKEAIAAATNLCLAPLSDLGTRDPALLDSVACLQR